MKLIQTPLCRCLFDTVVFLGLLAVVSCGGSKVYSVRSGADGVASGGLFYALPRTEVCVDVTFRYRDTTSAPLRDFADDMLAADLPEELYVVEDVVITARCVADPDHYYYVVPGHREVSIDRRHLLRSVGMPADTAAEVAAAEAKAAVDVVPREATYNLYDRTDTFYRRGDRAGHPSFLAAKKDTRSLRQRALAAAERIGALQDRRQQLVAGEVDEGLTPEMMRYQLERIDEQEQMLVEQFVGRYAVETVRFVVTPKDQKTSVEDERLTLFYYSPSSGVADSGSADAVPVVISIHCDNSLGPVARFVRHRTGDAASLDKRSSFKYRCSEQATVSVSSLYFHYQQTVPVSQYGPVMELPDGDVKAQFDAVTGDLLFFGGK